MSSNEIHIGDVGTVFYLTITEDGVAVDISGATGKSIIFEKPSGDTLTKAGIFTTDGTDGKIQYTTIDGDLDESGTWRIQSIITTATSEHHSDIKEFVVYKNI